MTSVKTIMDRAEAERIERLQVEVDRLTAKLAALRDGTWQWLELRQARQFPEPVTANALAEAFQITPQAANNRLMRLVRGGLLSRERVPGGERGYQYQMVLWLDGAAGERAAEILRRAGREVQPLGLHDLLWAAVAGYEAQYGRGSIGDQQAELPGGAVERIDALAKAAHDVTEWSHPQGSWTR